MQKQKNAMKKDCDQKRKKRRSRKICSGKSGNHKRWIYVVQKTVKAIKAYQRKHNLKVDGMAGYNTLIKMVS